MAMNTFADLGAAAQTIQERATLVMRATMQMPGIIRMFTNATGLNTRTRYEYNQISATTVGETDDLLSQSFTPAANEVLTPGIVASMAYISDARVESEGPEDVINDASRELGLAATDKIESDLVGDLASLTAGTIGAAGTTITWGYVSAAIAQARYANKSNAIPLACVIHVYQAAILAKSASIAGATSLAQAPGVTEDITRRGLVPQFVFQGVPIYQAFESPDANDDFTGGVFSRDAIALDMRRVMRINPQRDESRGGGGTEFNMSLIYAHGVWRPALGVKMVFDATAPTS